jgi:hypothetical protein
MIKRCEHASFTYEKIRQRVIALVTGGGVCEKILYLSVERLRVQKA